MCLKTRKHITANKNIKISSINFLSSWLLSADRQKKEIVKIYEKTCAFSSKVYNSYVRKGRKHYLMIITEIDGELFFEDLEDGDTEIYFDDDDTDFDGVDDSTLD